jgi:Anaphase-promoting complex subunit 4 WD40 domain
MHENGAGEPTDDYDAAIVKFGAEMRALWDTYNDAHGGRLSYKHLEAMSKRRPGDTHLSPGWTADAFNGKILPSVDHLLTFVRLLASSSDTAELEAEKKRFLERRQELKKLRAARNAARAAGRKDPPPPNEETDAELTELRTLSLRQGVQINELTNQVTDLNHQVEELSRTADDAKEQERQLRQALLGLWPRDGVPLKGPQGVSSLAFHPDGRVLAAGYLSGLLRTWNPDSGQYIEDSVVSHDRPVHCMAYTDDGKVLVTGGGDGTVRLADPRTGRPLGDPLVRLNHGVRAVAFGRCIQRWPGQREHLLAVGDQSGAVRVWSFSDVPRGDASFALTAGGPVQALAFVPNHDALAVATEFSRVTVHRHDGFTIRGDACVFGDIENAAVRTLSFGPAKDVMVVSDAVGWVHLLTLSAADPLRVEQRGKFSVGFPVHSVASCSGSPLLAFAGAVKVVLRELGSSASKESSISGQVRSIAFRPDGELIAVGMADGDTQLHSVAHARSRLTPTASARRRRRRRK